MRNVVKSFEDEVWFLFGEVKVRKEKQHAKKKTKSNLCKSAAVCMYNAVVFITLAIHNYVAELFRILYHRLCVTVET